MADLGIGGGGATALPASGARCGQR